ncbi:serine/threonine-protein phosphatase 1 regulatory subunit 10-like isoform X2 [Amphibalanus amphitrite]|uniref:serine/threonine-protein phosphatase 1 regulatory subunit 10-like isoform X2 n=1 Tax=Amphibalanus amphitrite TaxID=1232801 RepID=UPI001C9260AB|nr:serine/threonine-protein phosphatase 1 regulatory subunit 10-like isoform X2 [Amphibalanus amphitrite]
MSRIDPLNLLITLSVLLGPDGAIKKDQDVQRVVNFYSRGGWELVTGWFSDACERENWRLLEDMLRLFKGSPVTVERLKTNHCPKQVKHLSKEAQCEDVRKLAQEVVDIWMKVIKGEPGTKEKKKSGDSEERREDNTWKMEMRNGIFVIKKVDIDQSATAVKRDSSTSAEEEDVKESTADGDEDGADGGSGDKEGDEGKTKREAQNTTESGAMEVDGEEGAKGKTEGEGNDKSASTEPAKGASSPATGKDSDTKSKGDSAKKDDESKSPRGKKREHSSSRSDSKSKRKSTDKSSDRGSDKSSDKGSDKSSSSRDKSKSSSSSKHSSKESSRHRKSHKDHRDRHKSRESEKQREREKEKERERKRQSEKDKETLAKVQGVGLGKLGAIPKKKPTDPEKKGSPGSAGSAAAAAGEGTATAKKPLLPTPSDRRAPTVKTFGAKFRSTGLEEASSTAAAPKRKPAEVVRPPLPPPPKRAPAPEPTTVSSAADKRARIEQRPPVERPGGIKVIPPKPLHLQEASGFMDALNASTDVKRKVPKRTRRLSSREDSKEEKKGETTPTTPPAATSPVAAKPLLKFYQDTQQDQEEEDKKEKEEEEKKPDADAEKAEGEQSPAKDAGKEPSEPDEEERAPTPPTIPLERRPSEAEPEPRASPPREPGQPRGVLVYHRPAARRKLSVRWRPDNQLVDVSYFDLDENERVNVNRAKFMEMQAMEKMREREFLRRARGSRDDGMAEQMAWQMLIVVDKPPPLAAPGARSQERAIQEERERSSLPAFFNPNMLPDTPSEPEPELHHERTPCRPVPLDDDQGGATVKDHSADGWPEPRPEPRAAMLPAPMGGPGGPPGQMPPQMMGPGMMPPPNSWGPSGPMQPGMDPMMPPDMMGAPMGMHGPSGYGVPPRPMGPPGGGWGPITPPMGPGGMMSGPTGMMGGPGGMSMMSGPGPRPPYGGGGGGGGGYRGGGRGGWRGSDDRRPRHETPCKHHLSGFCRKGVTCHFLHLPRNGGGGGDSPRGRSEPQRGRVRDEYV